MFGRKQRRIIELERQLNDLLNVTVVFPEPAATTFAAAPVKKGCWYRATIEFQVGDDYQRVRNLGLFESEATPYFDGSFPPPSEDDEEAHAS